MKHSRLFLAALALLILLSVSSPATAAEGRKFKLYTDAPSVMTQDSLLELTAEQIPAPKGSDSCTARVLQPDRESAELLHSVYSFVWDEENRPVEYYDEQTQLEIRELCGDADPKKLHMTEHMRLRLAGAPEKDAEYITLEMDLEADYQPEQLVIVVLGIPGKDYTWYPYRADVKAVGQLRWDIPAKEWAELMKQPISFQVLTVRLGPGGQILWYEEPDRDSDEIFSKSAEDVNRIRYWYTEEGDAVEDPFRVFEVPLTDAMREELKLMEAHLEKGSPILDYFPEDRREEALLMLPQGIDPETLIAYDAIALMDENYKDTYGDITVEFLFGSSYDPEKPMVVMAAFEGLDERGQPCMDWYVLRARALEIMEDDTLIDLVELSPKQLNLPVMEEKPLMLVVISEELEP